MHLKRLELLGFKSFADRTVLVFDSSLTGVVGPNGCGKSNVVDAVRWSLGEQRPASMRGDEMADVIFKGSASRPAMSVAEVTLVLDNENGAIANHGAEISVTRRVYKSGEGEYLINGDRVRLKDVREMLFDTGLGSRGYAVLEQGRIDAVLSANPVERRSIFEEAAGISRYRQRRKETESRLARVQSDVVRLDDVVSELERRSRSLKIQAGRARRYVEARDSWKVEGERLARHQVHGLNASLANLGMRIEEMESRAERGRSARETAGGDVQAREREQEVLSGEVERLSNETSEVAGELRALDERRVQLQARVRGWEASAEDEAQRAVQLERKLGERTRESEELRERLATLGAESQAVAERLVREEERTRELSREYTRSRAEAERQNEAVLGLLHERTSLQNAVEHLERALEPLRERASRGDERLLESARSLAEARAVETRAAGEIERAGAALRVALERRSVFEREAEELDGTAARLRRERAELEVERARLKARAESLLDRERERELLESGAREVLAGLDDGSGP
ncbi:MAG: AAA family ATPase, partial [Planctomycetota bacterium]|nr:AAA family ATPase [Planctomycetota bacterium]